MPPGRRGGPNRGVEVRKFNTIVRLLEAKNILVKGEGKCLVRISIDRIAVILFNVAYACVDDILIFIRFGRLVYVTFCLKCDVTPPVMVLIIKWENCLVG